MGFMPWSHPWLLSTPHQSANLIDSIFKECTDPNYFPLSLLPLLCSNQIAALNYCIRLPTAIFLPLPSSIYYKQNRENVLKCSQIMSLLCSKSFNGSCYLSDFIIYNSPSHFCSNHTDSLSYLLSNTLLTGEFSLAVTSFWNTLSPWWSQDLLPQLLQVFTQWSPPPWRLPWPPYFKLHPL